MGGNIFDFSDTLINLYNIKRQRELDALNKALARAKMDYYRSQVMSAAQEAARQARFRRAVGDLYTPWLNYGNYVNQLLQAEERDTALPMSLGGRRLTDDEAEALNRAILSNSPADIPKALPIRPTPPSPFEVGQLALQYGFGDVASKYNTFGKELTGQIANNPLAAVSILRNIYEQAGIPISQRGFELYNKMLTPTIRTRTDYLGNPIGNTIIIPTPSGERKVQSNYPSALGTEATKMFNASGALNPFSIKGEWEELQ